MFYLIFGMALLVILLRTFLFKSTLDKSKQPKEFEEKPGRAAEILSKAITCRSVSYPDYDKFDYPEFSRFLEIIQESFPLFNRTCHKEILNNYSLVYCWKGRDSSLKPLLLLGHYDVVPVEQGAEESWTRGPFSGEIAQGFLWGRGTLDMKVQIIAHLEAAERLLEQGWQPERDIWFSYNFDEEQGGTRGASGAVTYFEKRGITFDMVFDEGGAIVQGVMPGVKAPMAIIGLGEKGIGNIKVQVKGAGGHSSTPPTHTAIGKLGKIIADLEAKPMPARLTAPVRAMLSVIGPEMPWVTRMALANMYLFKPLVLKIFSKGATTNAMIRTSVSATMIQGGDAPNVLPLQAEAIINVRLLPGDSGESALDHIRKTALKSCEEKDFTLETIFLREASPVSSHLTEQYRKITRGIGEIYPDVLISPYLMMGGSDSSKFSALSDNIYRFMPILITNEELSTIHNRNERISLINIERAAVFFQNFIKQYN